MTSRRSRPIDLYGLILSNYGRTEYGYVERMCVLAGKNIGRHRRTHEQEVISAATFKMERNCISSTKLSFCWTYISVLQSLTQLVFSITFVISCHNIAQCWCVILWSRLTYILFERTVNEIQRNGPYDQVCLFVLHKSGMDRCTAAGAISTGIKWVIPPGFYHVVQEFLLLSSESQYL